MENAFKAIFCRKTPIKADVARICGNFFFSDGRTIRFIEDIFPLEISSFPYSKCFIFFLVVCVRLADSFLLTQNDFSQNRLQSHKIPPHFPPPISKAHVIPSPLSCIPDHNQKGTPSIPPFGNCPKRPCPLSSCSSSQDMTPLSCLCYVA